MAIDDGVEITFPDLTPAEAGQLARELELELAKSGIPRDQLRIARANNDAMDMGTILMVAGAMGGTLALDVAKDVIKDSAKRATRNTFGWLLRKWGTRAVVKTASGESVIVGEAPAKAAAMVSAKASGYGLSEFKTLGLVLLGASQFPHMPASKKLDNPAFKRSAELARQAFSPQHMVFRDTAVLDLFDQDVRTEEIVDRIEHHVAAYPDMRDVVIYYCGHGDFMGDRERSYYLTLRGTRPGREPATGLPLKTLRYMIEQQPALIDKRFYFVLDCCFAGAAVDAFQAGGLDPIVAAQVRDVLPERGWAFLTASDRSMPAIGRDGGGATMFTGALTEVLEGKVAGVPGRLALADLGAETARHIKMKHRLEAVLPQVHAPMQTMGDVSRIPMFLVGGAAKAGAQAAMPPPISSPPPPQRTESAGLRDIQSGELFDQFLRGTAPRPDASADKEREVAFWNSIKETNDPAELEEFLKHYGEGPFASLARLRLRKLNDAAARPAAPKPASAWAEAPRDTTPPPRPAPSPQAQPAWTAPPAQQTYAPSPTKPAPKPWRWYWGAAAGAGLGLVAEIQQYVETGMMSPSSYLKNAIMEYQPGSALMGFIIIGLGVVWIRNWWVKRKAGM